MLPGPPSGLGGQRAHLHPFLILTFPAGSPLLSAEDPDGLVSASSWGNFGQAQRQNVEKRERGPNPSRRVSTHGDVFPTSPLLPRYRALPISQTAKMAGRAQQGTQAPPKTYVYTYAAFTGTFPTCLLQKIHPTRPSPRAQPLPTGP